MIFNDISILLPNMKTFIKINLLNMYSVCSIAVKNKTPLTTNKKKKTLTRN